MTGCRLDHIVIGARTLKAGIAHLEAELGVAVPEGGKHPLMGTHNALMQLGHGVFLEIIAVDPDAPPPGRPRWFTLDDPATTDRIAERPVLLTWVVRCDDIEAAVAKSLVPPGPVEEGRRGDLVWRITIPRDGSMPEDGVFPTLIQWPGGVVPGNAMPDLGCRLESLTLRYRDPGRLRDALAAIGADGLAEVVPADAQEGPRLRALIRSPRGLVEIA